MSWGGIVVIRSNYHVDFLSWHTIYQLFMLFFFYHDRLTYDITIYSWYLKTLLYSFPISGQNNGHIQWLLQCEILWRIIIRNICFKKLVHESFFFSENSILNDFKTCTSKTSIWNFANYRHIPLDPTPHHLFRWANISAHQWPAKGPVRIWFLPRSLL